MNENLRNALAFFKSAPQALQSTYDVSVKAVNQSIQMIGDAAKSIAEWIWGVLLGDFNDDQSTSQIVAGTAISMIPYVDQICDVRDIVACSLNLKNNPDSLEPKISLGLTLVGIIPTLGSFLKGCFKIVFSKLKRLMKARRIKKANADFYKLIEEQLDNCIIDIKKFHNDKDVQKFLKKHNIQEPYSYLAEEIKNLRAQLNVAKLRGSFKDVKEASDSLINYVIKYAPQNIQVQAKELRTLINKTYSGIDGTLNESIGVLNNILLRLQRRLEIEQDALFRASKNIKSIHRISGINAYDAFKKKLPIWVNKGKKNLLHKQRQGLVSAELKKISEGWPDISEKGGRATRNAFNTFSIKEMKAVIIPEGETLYRVLDPSSADNSICWMRESEFKKLKSKADWRKKFAVWPNWNNNGEFITYKVPPGGIKVWEGPAASQTLDKSGLPPYGIEKLPKMEQDKILKREREIKQDANQYSLEGGGKQIVLEPKDLQISQISERKKTNWGYGDSDLGHSPNLVGVPILSNKV